MFFWWKKSKQILCASECVGALARIKEGRRSPHRLLWQQSQSLRVNVAQSSQGGQQEKIMSRLSVARGVKCIAVSVCVFV